MFYSMNKIADRSEEEALNPPELVLLLENPSKGNNLGSILRCASASGVRQILTVGYDKCAVHGAHGADRHVTLIAFPTPSQAVQALPVGTTVIGLLGAFPDGYKNDGCSVELDEQTNLVIPRSEPKVTQSTLGFSYPVYSLPLSTESRSDRAVCLVFSKDRLGLPLGLAEQCHLFCHVPCIPLAEPGPPLLDGPSSLTITMHHLTELLGYDEATFEGHKFQVIKPTVSAAERADQHEIRKQKRQENYLEARSAAKDNMANAIFGMDESKAGDY